VAPAIDPARVAPDRPLRQTGIERTIRKEIPIVAADISRAASGLVAVNGIELGYETFGVAGEATNGATPLILLHGGFGSVEMFGPNVAALAATRRVIGADLQSHGRTPAPSPDRPMRFETMADDIAALIRHLGLPHAVVMGFSLGGAVALRTAIQHPDVVRRLILVSTVVRRSGWHPEMLAGMDAMGPEIADMLGQTPLGAGYRAIAPRPDDWPVLVTQLTGLMKENYDWTAEARDLRPPTLIVAGDADGLPPRHAVELFELLGGGQRDASWDRSGMTRHRLAILPGATHYDINVLPELAAVATAFLDETIAD
jgi:pimeloyl-ACP methyl ester carboxylesterase